MKTSLKVLVLSVLVVAISFGLFTARNDPEEKNNRKVVMIANRLHQTGFDRYGRPLAVAQEIQKTDNFGRLIVTDSDYFGLSTNSENDGILVANPYRSTVMKFNYDADFIYNVKFSTSDENMKNMGCPDWSLRGVVDVCDNILGSVNSGIVDSNSKTVYNFEMRAPYFLIKNDDNLKLSSPISSAYFEKGEIWNSFIVDRMGNKVVCTKPPDAPNTRCSLSKVLFTIPPDYEKNDATTGEKPGEFSNPCGICFEHSGRIIVADTGNNRIQFFDENGKFISSYSEGLSKPMDVSAKRTIEPDGRIYIADTGNKRIVIIDMVSSRELMTIANPDFVKPCSVLVDCRNDIWVGDSGCDRLYKFAGIDSVSPGQLIARVDDVLASEKREAQELKIEINKYSAKINETSIKIKPYAQTVGGLVLIPTRFMVETIFNSLSDKKVKIDFDKATKCYSIEIPEITFTDGEVYKKRLIEFEVETKNAYVNGEQLVLPSKSQNIDGTFFVPIDSLTDLFGVDVVKKFAKDIPVTKNDNYTIYFPPIK